VKGEVWEKYERQMNLLAALRNTSRPMRLQEIREKVPGYGGSFEASRRRFIRDKEELVALGVPIRTVEGSAAEETGYLVDPGAYELPPVDLDAEELAALHMALRTLSIGVEDGQAERMMWRFGGIVESETAAESVEHLLGGLGELPAPPDLLRMVRAAADRRVVSFVYETNEGEIAERSLEPWSVEFTRGRWYLRGFDRDRNEERNYRFDRILGEVKVSSEAAVSSPAPSRTGVSDPWEYGDGDAVMVDLWVDQVLAPQVALRLGAYPSTPGRDGGTLWTLPVTNWPAFRTYVLTFLGRAEIIGPPEARADMVTWLTAIEASGGGD